MNDALGAPQSVLVLGGASDIGIATAAALARRRARRVVLAGRDRASLEAQIPVLRAAGATDVSSVRFDALDVESHPTFVDAVFAAGDIDLVLVAFGVVGEQGEAQMAGRAAVELVRTNYVGAVSVLVPIVARMRAQGHGTIVILSSVAAVRPRKANFVYGSSKAGLDAFGQGLADALSAGPIHVLVVRPGFVHTKMTRAHRPAPFATTPDRVASAIIRGLERRATTVWAPPVVRWLMTLLRRVPRTLWRRIER